MPAAKNKNFTTVLYKWYWQGCSKQTVKVR